MIDIFFQVIVILYSTSVFVIALYAVLQLFFLIIFVFKKERIENQNKQINFPIVTVQLPVFNEKFVIERLIDKIILLDYPKNKLQIQVIDDSTDETLLISQKKVNHYKSHGFDIELVHRTDRIGYKAGALQHAMQFVKGDFIAIFDADFLPKSDFLLNTIHSFSDDKIAVVQCRWQHINQTQNLLTEVQAIQLNAHFTIEQNGRYLSDKYLQFNGTAGIWRKDAIVDAGGWHDDTLTEDLDLSYRAQLRGWKIKYLLDVLTPSELPDNIQGIKSQQFRWMKGGAETAKKILPLLWKANIPLNIKIHGSFHLLASSIFVFVFGISLLSVPMAYNTNHGYFQYLATFNFFVLPIFIIIYFYSNVIIAWEKSFFLKKVIKFVLIFPLFLCLSMGLSLHNTIAVIQGWIGKKSSFIRTPKKGDQKTGSSLYKLKNSKLSFIGEGLMTFYLLGAICFSFYYNNFNFIPLHMMLLIGNGYIFISTLNYNIKYAT